MRDLFNPSNQAFSGERIKKEVVARTTWHTHYGHKYLKEASKTRSQSRQAPFGSVLKAGPVSSTGSPVRKEAGAGCPETSGVQGSRVRQARRGLQYPAPQDRPEDLEMKPPAPATLKLLFQGISHDGQGRTLYLKERHQLIPEKKYKYPMVSSWEYGWHVGDVMKDYRTPAHAKTHPISKSSYIKNGISLIHGDQMTSCDLA